MEQKQIKLKGEYGDKLQITQEGDVLIFDAYLDGVTGIFTLPIEKLLIFMKQEKDYN